MDKNYKILQQAVQKAQNQIRKHIGLQQQMKICFDQQQDQINQLKKNNNKLKEHNSQLKKQILYLKNKQKQIEKKVKGLQQNQDNRNEIKTNITRFQSKKKKNQRIYTQEQNNLIFSDTQYKKSLKNQYNLAKDKHIHKSGGNKQLNSKNYYPSNLIQNQINVNLYNYTKINTEQNINKIKNNESKQIFWNRRLKTKPTNSYINFSTNVSPRMKKDKRIVSKDRYQTVNNNRLLNKSKKFTNQLMSKQKRKAYSNSNSMEMKPSFGNRSISIGY